MNLHYHVHPGDGPYLFLVHGFLTSSVQWRDNLAALAEVVTPVTIDLWGHGDSPTPNEAAVYHPRHYVVELERIRTALGATSILLCGYSLGAGLTLRYALTHPGRVIAQVFTNSSSGLADAQEQAGWRATATGAGNRIRAGGLAAIEALPVHPKRAQHLSPSMYTALTEDAARLRPEGVARTLEITNPNASVRDEVGRNRSPSLLVCGTRESRFRSKRDYVAAQMPHLQIADLNVGHGVNMEDPAAFNGVVVAFFKAAFE